MAAKAYNVAISMSNLTYWRVDVSPRSGHVDPTAAAALSTLRDFGLSHIREVRASRVYLLTLEGENDAAITTIAARLLADPVTEQYTIRGEADNRACPHTDAELFEVFPRPGVTDPAAASAVESIKDMGHQPVDVRTGRRYLLWPRLSDDDARRAMRLLANESVDEVIRTARAAGPPPQPAKHDNRVRTVPLLHLSVDALTRLSREGHLFLSTDEMRAIQAHYQALGRDPTDLELETLAQTWSEHCVHKTLKSAIAYAGDSISLRVDHQANASEIRYANLLKDTIARATMELQGEGRGPTCLSVFKDNAGIIAFDDEFAIAFKAETHNRPSAIEPYGGAATSIGGCIRDVMGSGLGAKPIANTDVFCVAPPDWPLDAVPRGVIHPKTVLRGIVAGVRDYGNRMGIPTVNGAVHVDPRYLGNPLVFCGCVGLIPRNRIEKGARVGDLIVVVGGRTGRDGIHGATFSSSELTGTHADEFSHAVQIGNAIEEKKVLDAILLARDHPDGCLYTAITDCGAGGLSSAVGEMAAETGAEVDLEHVALKYTGLRYDEIWISESQERMVLAVPPNQLGTLRAVFAAENVEAVVIGRFTGAARLVVRHNGQVVGDMACDFLHDGLPRMERQATWTAAPRDQHIRTDPAADETQTLLSRLAHPTVASKEWIVRQYDHEVGGRSVVKPLTGRGGPADAAVIRPRLDSARGIAIGCGLCPQVSDDDPYWMAICAIDEAIRNVVCVGGDPQQTAILDNFCWGRTDDPHTLGALVRACQGCYDAAKRFGTPFISGKDSLNNEFALDAADVDMVRRNVRGWQSKSLCGPAGATDPVRNGRLAIPGTLLISAVSLVENVTRCITTDLKRTDSALVLVGPMADPALVRSGDRERQVSLAAAAHQTVAQLIRRGVVRSAHDVSDGGLLTAAAEMAVAGRISCVIEADQHAHEAWAQGCNDVPGSYILELPRDRLDEVMATVTPHTPCMRIGQSQTAADGKEPSFTIRNADGTSSSVPVATLRDVWQAPLNW